MAHSKKSGSDDTLSSLASLEAGALVEIIGTQRAMIDELRQAIALLKTQNNELMQRLNTNSSNSHKPPSSDPPWSKPGKGKDKQGKKKQKKGRRKRGGQPGHEGKTRPLVPTEDADEVKKVKPTSCRKCGGKLRGEDPDPFRHQVWGFEILIKVLEYQLHSLHCPSCGTQTRADLPDGVPASSFDPDVHALVSMLSGMYRVSKRNIQKMLAEVFGLDASLGAISNMERTVCDAIGDAVEEAHEHVKQQPVANVDETGWKQESKTAWLWTAVTSLVTVFLVRWRRAKECAMELIGEGFDGVVGSDRCGSYLWVDAKQRQLCWAHLKRDFQKLADAGGYPGAVGEALLSKTKQLFELWYRVRDGTLKRSSFRTYVSGIRTQIRWYLDLGQECGVSKYEGMCEHILKLEPAMWTFVRVEGVEPTNNSAERSLRHGVIWRKVSFGTQSDRGSRFVERILTVAATCRQQGRNVFEFITNCCRKSLQGQPSPSLLPGQ